MGLVVYVCDQDTGIYRVEEGVGVTHTFDTPDATPCSYVTHNGAGKVVALGQPTTGSGGTFAQAFGFLLDPDDLSTLDGFWGPDAGSNTGQWVDVDDPPRVHTNFNVTFDGTGGCYDPNQDEVLVITEMRGYPDNVSSQDTDDMVAHLSPTGVFLRADKDIDASSPSTPLSSVQGKGVCVLGTKLYFDFGNASLCEYDVVTGATRSAYQCFTAMDDGGRNCGIKADPDNGWLWRMPSGGSSDGITNLQAFDPEDVPWGTTSGTPPTILATVKIADDNDGGWGYFQGFTGSSFDWAGDRAVVSVREWDSGDLAIISVKRDGSSTSPTLIYQDTTGEITGGVAYDMVVIPAGAWPLHLVRDDGVYWRVGPTVNPDGGLMRIVASDGTRYVQDVEGTLPLSVVAADGTVMARLPMSREGLTIYWTDDQLNRWSAAAGITSYAPAGGSVGLSCTDGAGGVLVFGDTANGPDGFPALGWRTDGVLAETDPLWVPTNGTGEWVLPGGDTISGYFITSYDGDGAYYDPVTGYAFVTGIFRRFEAVTGDPVAEHNVLVIDPDVGVVDSAIESFVDPFLYEPSGLGFGTGGQCVLGRKLYYLGNSNSTTIVELDMDTLAIRIAQDCFDAQRYGDMAARPGDATGIWVIDEFGYDSPYDVLLRRFEIEDLPWGTDDTPATASDEIVLFRDDFTGPPDTPVNVLVFSSATEVVYQSSQVAESNNLTWYRQSIDPLGDPEVLVELGTDWFDDHSEAYSAWLG